MTTTTNYGLQKPAETDYYDIGVQNGNMDAIDAQMKSNADAAAAAASAASSAQGAADDAVAAAAAAQGTADDAAEGVEALEAINTPLTTGGTAPNFTITPTPAITGYADGQQWTVIFHDDGDAPTLNVSDKGAAPLLEYPEKAAKVKAGQIARVMRKGTSFFTVSGGGGVALPDTIVAGDTPIWSNITHIQTNSSTYVNTGRSFTAVKAGIYRVAYYGNGRNSNTYCEMILRKNGTEIPNSYAKMPDSGGVKIIDVTLATGDVVAEWHRGYDGAFAASFGLFVFILAEDIQSELSKAVV